MFHALQHIDFKKHPVVIEGTYRKDTRSEQLLWEGHAICEHDILGILFILNHERVFWTKSEYLTTNQLRLSFFFHALPQPHHIQLLSELHYGMIDRFWCVLTNPPPAFLASTYTTGALIHFCDLHDVDQYRIQLLILSRDDIQKKRGGLWGVKERFLNNIDEKEENIAVYDILKYGRRNVFTLSPSSSE